MHDANVVTTRHLCRPQGRQFVVELDEDEPLYGADEVLRKRASARPYLHDLVRRLSTQRSDDLPLQIGVDEEVLPERTLGALTGRSTHGWNPGVRL